MNYFNTNLENGVLPIRKSGKKEPEVDILFTGDLCPRNRTEKLIIDGKSSDILEDFRTLIKTSDLSVTNLETPLTKADTPILKSGPNLKVHPKCIDLLKTAGFDIALLANNHIGDFGTKPVMETIRSLEKSKIRFAGAGKNLCDARKPLFVRKKGIRVVFLNYAENEFGGATDNKPGASTLDPLVNIGEIKAVSQKADVTIVVIHGGNERNPIPSPRMKKTYRAFADAGASAVISIHTHCPQGIEVWNGVPIVYSMGNFLFDNSSLLEADPTEFWWTGYCVKIKFNKHSALQLQVEPHTFAPDAAKIRLFDEKSKKQFYGYLARISKIIVDEKKALKFWEAWCSKAGLGLLSHLNNPELPVKSDAAMKKVLVTRNIFTCEAHNEVARTVLRLIEDHRLEKADKNYSAIEKLQKVNFDIIKRR